MSTGCGEPHPTFALATTIATVRSGTGKVGGDRQEVRTVHLVNSIRTTEYPFADAGERFGTVFGTVAGSAANYCLDHI
jgi:hypothetical protein